jgi:uncharacterized protein (DUF58 family)
VTGAAAHGTVVDVEALLRLRHVVAASRRGRARRTAALPGPIVTRRRGRGSETDDVRPWSHGDDVRHIDRNTTARTGEPHVRTFRDERDETALLVADFRPAMLFGTRRALRSVAAAEILALAGWRAVGLGGRVALLAVGRGEPVFVRPTAGERAMTAVIGGLARAHDAALALDDADDPPLADAFDMAGRSLKRGGSIVVATAFDAPGAGFDDAARRLAHRADVRVALVSDAFERSPPPGRYPFVTRLGRRGTHLADGRAGGLRAETDIARLARLGIAATRFDAERPAEAQLDLLRMLHGDLA